MPEFLVELYVAHDDHCTARQHLERAERATADLTREGQPLRCVRSIVVPQDETCFLLYEASSADVVAEALSRAGLRHEHISAASSSGPLPPVGGAPAPPILTRKGTTMTITTDYTELRDKQQKVWSSGDYNKIAAITVPLSEHLVDHVGVEPGVARPRRRDRDRPRRARGSPPRGRRGGHRLRRPAARHRAPPRRRGRPRGRLRPGGRREPAVRRRRLRHRPLRDRRDVQRRPRACGSGARPRLPAGRPHRRGELDARGLRRRNARRGRPARHTSGRRPAADPLGHRGRRR